MAKQPKSNKRTGKLGSQPHHKKQPASGAKAKRVKNAFKQQYLIADAIINSSPDVIIFALDRAYRYINFNENHRREMKKVYGCEIHLGDNMLDLITIPEVKPVAKASSMDRVLRGESFREVNEQPNTGAWYEFLWQPIKENNGQIIGLSVFIQDITERKRTEKLLQQSEEKYRMLVDNALAGVYMTNIKGDLLYVNQTAMKILEFDSIEEMLSSKALARYKNPKDRDVLLNSLKKMGKVTDFEFESITKKGNKRNLLLSAVLSGEILTGTIIDITERKKAEESLFETQRQIEFILGAAKTGLDIVDSQFNLRYVDPEWTKVYGNWAGRKCYDYFMGRSVPCSACEVPKALETKQPVIAEGALDKESKRLSQVTIIPYQGKNGEWLAAEVNVDITEREKAERSLKESETRLRTLFNSASDAIMTLAPPDWKFTGCNPATLKMFKAKDEQEFISKGPWNISPDKQPDGELSVVKAKRLIDQAMKTGRNFFEWTYKRPDGQEFPVNVLLTRMKINGQDLLQATVRDITESKRAEDTLRKSEMYLSNAMNLAKLGYWELDIASGIFTFTDSFYAIFRTTEKGMGGYKMTIADYARRFVHPADSNMVADETRKAIETDDPNFSRQLEHRMIYADGSEGQIAVRFFIVKDKSGKTIKTYGVNQDITERKKLESQLLHSQKIEAVGRLAGGIAHDFNNILTVIDGYCSITLEDVKDNPTLADNLQVIRKAVERAANLTRQLLVFSRKQPLQTKVINLNNLVTDTAKMLHRVIGEDIKLIIDLFPESADIQADPGQMEQVLMNLAINARDAMPTGGQITIKTANISLSPDQAQAMPEAQPGNFIRLLVQDTGTGMTDDVKKHLFEPFFTTKERGKGTGLGLSVVYGIVKQHNGWINVRSEAGKGSDFDIYLPVAAASTAQPSSKIRIQGFKTRGTNQRILVIEDEPGIRDIVAFGLRKSGYQVFEAASVAQARQIFEQEKRNFDVIFSDVILPDGNGIELVGELSAINPKIRIIISSGYMDDRAQLKVIEDKGYQFLPKPYNITRLISTILKAQ